MLDFFLIVWDNNNVRERELIKMEMTLKNTWNTFKIRNLTFEFNNDSFSPIIIFFDFEVLESDEYLEKKEYQDIDLLVENNLPYTALLKEILKKCEEIIEKSID